MLECIQSRQAKKKMDLHRPIFAAICACIAFYIGTQGRIRNGTAWLEGDTATIAWPFAVMAIVFGTSSILRREKLLPLTLLLSSIIIFVVIEEIRR